MKPFTPGYILNLMCALLIVVMLGRFWNAGTLFLQGNGATGGIYAAQVLLAILFFGLNLLSVVGLVIGKRWGYRFTYGAIIVTTFWFSGAYIPHIAEFLPQHYQLYATVSLNLMFLVAVVCLHVADRHAEQLAMDADQV